MRNTTLAAVAIVLLLVLAGTAASAPEVDQQQPTLDPTWRIRVSGSDGARMGQIVTAGIPGLLTEVQLPVGCEPDANLLVEIRNDVGVPGPRVLASRTVPGTSLGRNLERRFHSIALPSPPFIAAEAHFAIVLASAEQSGCITAMGPRGTNPYPRGSAFYSRPDFAWRELADGELAFKTVVERRCGVPPLAAIPLTDVDPLLADSGCTRGRVRRAFSKRVPAGVVLSQSPAENTLLPPGSPVALVVSKGPQPCAVPRLRGMTLAHARTALTRANCRLGRVRRRAASGTRRGRVVAQRPAPGARRPAGTRVNIVLSR